MEKKSFDRFSFIDKVSMEIVVTYDDKDKSYIRQNVRKMINWIMKNCNKISNIIFFSKTFGVRNKIEICFSEFESSYFMLIDYELLRKYVADLNEKIIWE